MSAGKKSKELVKTSKPLTIVRIVNTYSALQATKIGHKALYLPGSSVASASYGLPDLGIVALEEVCIDIGRICSRVDTPLLVDADTDFGDAFNITRAIKELIRAGAAATHIEDQVAQKRCGHRSNKELVSTEGTCDRIKVAVGVKIDPDFMIMAKTDTHAIEGQQKAIERALAYVEAGAEMVSAEAVTSLKEHEEFVKNVKVPILANTTGFGETPYFIKEGLNRAGVSMMLCPLSADRVMDKAVVQVYESILKNEHQKDVLEIMQTREKLYEVLDYYSYEQGLDELSKRGAK